MMYGLNFFTYKGPHHFLWWDVLQLPCLQFQMMAVPWWFRWVLTTTFLVKLCWNLKNKINSWWAPLIMIFTITRWWQFQRMLSKLKSTISENKYHTVLFDWESPRLHLRTKLSLFNMCCWQMLKVLLCCFLRILSIDIA